MVPSTQDGAIRRSWRAALLASFRSGERPPLERGPPRCAGAQRYPAGHPAPWRDDTEEVACPPRPRPDRGRDEPPKILRRAERREAAPTARPPRSAPAPRPDRWRLPRMHAPFQRPGAAEVERVARPRLGKGASRPDVDFSTNDAEAARDPGPGGSANAPLDAAMLAPVPRAFALHLAAIRDRPRTGGGRRLIVHAQEQGALRAAIRNGRILYSTDLRGDTGAGTGC